MVFWIHLYMTGEICILHFRKQNGKAAPVVLVLWGNLFPKCGKSSSIVVLLTEKIIEEFCGLWGGRLQIYYDDSPLSCTFVSMTTNKWLLKANQLIWDLWWVRIVSILCFWWVIRYTLSNVCFPLKFMWFGLKIKNLYPYEMKSKEVGTQTHTLREG